MTQNTVIGPNNTFTLNQAVKYPTELQVPIQQINPSSDIALRKTFEPITKPTLFGKGPVVFFNCTELRNCTFEVSNGTFFNDSRVYDISTESYITDNTSEYTNIRSMFYTDVKPAIPEYLRDQLEQRFLLYFFGSNAVFMPNITEQEGYLTIASSKLKRRCH